MKWRTHEEKPDTTEPVTALLVIPDPPSTPIIAGIYHWKEGEWKHEDSYKPCAKPFFWVLEDDLVDTVRFVKAQPPLRNDPAALENMLTFLEQAGAGCISGKVIEWPQLKPSCAWAAERIRNCNDNHNDIAVLQNQISTLKELLRQIYESGPKFRGGVGEAIRQAIK